MGEQSFDMTDCISGGSSLKTILLEVQSRWTALSTLSLKFERLTSDSELAKSLLFVVTARHGGLCLVLMMIQAKKEVRAIGTRTQT